MHEFLPPPAWTHMHWTDESADAFVRETYLPRPFGDFDYSVWQRLYPPIKKWDALRYMLLYQFGGIYADTDMVVFTTTWCPGSPLCP